MGRVQRGHCVRAGAASKGPRAFLSHEKQSYTVKQSTIQVGHVWYPPQSKSPPHPPLKKKTLKVLTIQSHTRQLSTLKRPYVSFTQKPKPKGIHDKTSFSIDWILECLRLGFL